MNQTKPNPDYGKLQVNGTADKRKTIPVFRGIGPLTALLIIGDCAEAGLMHMPTTQQMADLVATLKKGAKTGLARLGMIAKDKPTDDDIMAAFVRLSHHLNVDLSEDEKNDMHYNILMLEHGLCKYSRLIPDSSKKKQRNRRV